MWKQWEENCHIDKRNRLTLGGDYGYYITWCLYETAYFIHHDWLFEYGGRPAEHDQDGERK